MADAFQWSRRLAYADADRLPIRRVRWGRGFTYRDADGGVVSDKATRRRIDALAIPPAWEKVRIAAAANWHIQAIGRDARGRRQYRYHPEWVRKNKQRDFARLIGFAERAAENP